jgi:predicted DCC family thiol-disulfide oxidoreductase YuxK
MPAPDPNSQPSSQPNPQPNFLVLFDGLCNLCNASVQWIIARDPKALHRFASLQSEPARRALQQANAPAPLPDSIILIDAQGIHTKSTAALRIARRLGFPWSVAALALVLPKFLRDSLYDFIAARRYRWFGKRDACMVPTPDLRQRFLDAEEPPAPHAPATSSSASAASPAASPSRFATWLLRVVMVYFVLYVLPFPLGSLPFTEVPAQLFTYVKQAIITDIAERFFVDKITAYPLGSGDTTYNYIELLVFLVLALVIASLWSLRARFKPIGRRTLEWHALYIRLNLAGFMLGYGFAKVFPMQMPAPGPDRLLQPFGDASPMGLLWTFIGASTAYQMFAGAGELLAGLLLFFRRTALAGALVAAGVLVNVVALNMCYDVPVKQFSIHLLLMSLYLIAPHAMQLIGALFLSVPVRPAPLAPDPTQRKSLRLAYHLVPLVLLLISIGFGIFGSIQALREYGPLAPKQPWEGLYRIDSFTRDGIADRALPDQDRWVRAGISSSGLATIIRADGSAERLYLAFDEDKGSIELLVLGQRTTTLFTYTLSDEGTLTLTGALDTKPVTMTLKRLEDAKPILVNRGFRWINETPYNR